MAHKDPPIGLTAGFTGTQQGMTIQQRQAIRVVMAGFEVGHHGDCIGSDAEFHAICLELEKKIVVHPPSHAGKRAFCRPYTAIRPERPYLVRNAHIVDQTELLIATPAQYVRPASLRGQGTWWTITHADQLGKQLLIVLPDGECVTKVPT